MRKSIYVFLLLSISIILTSCSGNDNKEILKYTTDKTLGIVKVNLKQLDSKIPKQEILNNQNYNFSASDKVKLNLFVNAGDNGLNIDKPLYILTDQDSKNNYVISFFCSLKDKDKFQSNFSAITESNVRIDDKSKLVYSNNKLIGSVNEDDMFVLSFSIHNPYNNDYYEQNNNDLVSESYYNELRSRKGTENKNIIDQIEKSLDKEYDVCAWVNVYNVISNVTKGYNETLAINKLLIDSGIGFNMNFKEGKVVLNTQTFFNEDLKKIVEKNYDGKSVDYSIVDNIELNNSEMYSLGFLSMDFMKYFIKEAGFESTVNRVLQEKNLTMEDLTQAFNGNYAFTSDKVVQTNSIDDPYSYTPPSVTIALGINGAKAKKVIDFLNNEIKEESNSKLFSNDKLLVISSSENNIEMLKTNRKAINSNLDKKSDINSYSWVNVDNVNKQLENNSKKLKMQKIVTVSKFKDGNATTETTLEFDKKDKNILSYILGNE